MESFGSWLRQQRKQQDLTQGELADRAGCAIGTLRNIEIDRARPSKQLATRLAKGLGIAEADISTVVAFARNTSLLPATPLPGAPAPPNGKPAAGARTHLPAQLTGLIGREQEVEAVKRLLLRPDVRLVTLSGPGGIGKTRLAVACALQVQAAFADGVCFVDLAAIRNPALVLATIAQALGLRTNGGQPLAGYLAATLQQRAMLLLLDNFEQVVAAAPLVTKLLAACPQLKVLTTSRVVLDVTGEYAWLVPPLTLPDRADPPPFAQLSQYESVRLFDERARAANQSFAITPSNAPAVAEICHQLDGLPLAIELAAARVKLFAPQALLARLDRRLTFLMGGRERPTRQQTIRNTIDWSYQLLTAREQTVFQRLGVFMGSATLAAIEAICGDSELVDTVSTLVNSSLLYRLPPKNDATETDERFGMLETIREYAIEQLAATPAAATVQLRYAHYYLALAQDVIAQWEQPTANTIIAQLDREYDNLRAVLAWAYAQRQATIGLQLASGLVKFWQRRGYFSEGRTWLERLLTLQDDPPDLPTTTARLHALEGAARLATHQYDFARSSQLFMQSMELRRALGEPEHTAPLVGSAAVAARVEGQYTRAATLLEEVLAQQRMRRDTGSLGNAGLGLPLVLLGIVRREQGDFARARLLFEECIALHRAIGDREGIGVGLLGLADIARDQGDIPGMQRYGMASLTIVRELQVYWAVGVVLSVVAFAAYLEGDLTRARALSDESVAVLRAQHASGILPEVLIANIQIMRAQHETATAYTTMIEALELAMTVGPRIAVVMALEVAADLVLPAGQIRLATQLLAAAAALRVQMGTPVRPIDQPAVEQGLALARAQLGDTAFAAIWQEAHQLPLEQLVQALPARL